MRDGAGGGGEGGGEAMEGRAQVRQMSAAVLIAGVIASTAAWPQAPSLGESEREVPPDNENRPSKAQRNPAPSQQHRHASAAQNTWQRLATLSPLSTIGAGVKTSPQQEIWLIAETSVHRWVRK